MTETLYCFPCNMTFRVSYPHADAERATCECGRHFWHKATDSGYAIRVGVWPENVAEVA